jgi:hypothetical protein
LITGITVNKNCKGISKLPKIIITIDDVQYELLPEDYVYKFTNSYGYD